jgi:hypothetical protein
MGSKRPTRRRSSRWMPCRSSTCMARPFDVFIPCSSSRAFVKIALRRLLNRRKRLRQRVHVTAKLGYRQLGAIKSTTIHQEFRVLRRMLNVAVCKKLLAANPCSGVEFPVAVKGLFRPHYVRWSEQQTIESHGPRICGMSFASLRRLGCASTRN